MIKFILLISVISVDLFNVNANLQANPASKVKPYNKIPIREEDGYELLEKWINEAYSSLIATMANER